MGDQVYLFQLIIGWTCVGMFVATAVITLASIVGLLKIDADIRNKLLAAMVLEVGAIGVAVFAGLVQVDTRPVEQEIAESAKAQQTLQQLETPATALPTETAAAVTPRVYIQIADASQRPLAEKARATIREANQLAPGIELVGGKAPARNQLRYFHAEEAELATMIESELATAGIVAPPLLVPGYEDAVTGPHYFELWFGSSGN